MSKYSGITLHSNFWDYYDIWFDAPDSGEPLFTLERFSSGGMSRAEMLNTMRRVGIETPRFSVVKDWINPPEKMVVYTDDSSHRGEGKLLMPKQQALNSYPDFFSSEYIETFPAAVSYRWLQIGHHSFFLRYQSSDAWRSNCGENVAIDLLDAEFYRRDMGLDNRYFRHPLFAVDFIVSMQYELYYAIDFNASPGLKGTPISKLVGGRQIVEWLKEYINDKF